MALSRAQRLTLDPAEVEFMALESSITIVPLFSLDSLFNLDKTKEYGPFVPPQKSEVPMWLAVHLKRRRKCRIIIPDWLSVPSLEEIYRHETTSPDFSEMAANYLEVSKVLLECASDDFTQADSVRILLKDIREARQSKVRAGLDSLNAVHLAMPNLSTLEINEIRPFFTRAFQRLKVLDPEVERHAEVEQEWIKEQPRALAGGRYVPQREDDDDDLQMN